MGAAPPNQDAFDRCTANGAGLTGAAVDAELVLVAAAAVNPIDAGAIALNAFFQNVANCVPQLAAFLFAESI